MRRTVSTVSRVRRSYATAAIGAGVGRKIRRSMD